MVKKWVIIFVSFLALCSAAFCETKNMIDVPRMQQLYSLMEYEEIVRTNEGADWKEVKDPTILIRYCDALVETKRTIPKTLRHPNVSISMEKFVKGYLLLRTGHLQESILIFSELSNTMEGRLWGSTGLIEYALLTENILSFEEGLSYMIQIPDNTDSVLIKRSISYYSAWLSYMKGDYVTARNELQKARTMISVFELFELEVSIMLKENRLGEALNRVEDMIKKNPNYQNAHVFKAEIFLRTKSPEESLNYLAALNKKNSKMWKISILYAESLVNAGHVDKGLALLKRVAEERSFDIFPSLTLAELDMMHGDGKITKRVLKTYELSLIGLPIYDVLLARIHWYGSEKDKAEKYLALALSMNPMLTDALWFQYEKQMAQKNFNAAQKSLEILRKIDPYDVAVLVDLAELSCKNQAVESFNYYLSELMKSGRFVSDSIKERLVCIKK